MSAVDEVQILDPESFPTNPFHVFNCSSFEYVDDKQLLFLESALAKDLLCVVSRQPVFQPLSCPKGHMACSSCLEKVKWKCLHHCGTKGRDHFKSEINQHVLTTLNNLIVACKRCGEKIERDRLKNHLKHLCPLLCTHCQQRFLESEFSHHPCRCPYPDCASPLLYSDIQSHFRSCPCSEIVCSSPSYCLWKGMRKQLPEHLTTCPWVKLSETLKQKDDQLSDCVSKIRSLTQKVNRQSHSLNEYKQALFFLMDASHGENDHFFEYDPPAGPPLSQSISTEASSSSFQVRVYFERDYIGKCCFKGLYVEDYRTTNGFQQFRPLELFQILFLAPNCSLVQHPLFSDNEFVSSLQFYHMSPQTNMIPRIQKRLDPRSPLAFSSPGCLFVRHLPSVPNQSDNQNNNNNHLDAAEATEAESPDGLLVLFKYFSVFYQTMKWIPSRVVPAVTTLRQLSEYVRSYLKQQNIDQEQKQAPFCFIQERPLGCHLPWIYNEEFQMTPSDRHLLVHHQLDLTLQALDILSGTILIVQHDFKDFPTLDSESQNLYTHRRYEHEASLLNEHLPPPSTPLPVLPVSQSHSDRVLPSKKNSKKRKGVEKGLTTAVSIPFEVPVIPPIPSCYSHNGFYFLKYRVTRLDLIFRSFPFEEHPSDSQRPASRSSLQFKIEISCLVSLLDLFKELVDRIYRLSGRKLDPFALRILRPSDEVILTQINPVLTLQHAQFRSGTFHFQEIKPLTSAQD